jgi:uncharacterized membrane protein (DUF373 family)
VSSPEHQSATRTWIARSFSTVEDVVYVGLGLLLACGAVVLLVGAIQDFVQSVIGGTLRTESVKLLDHILLILLVVELLYTVQVSFREHALVPEPFLLVGLIAAIRRVLVLTAEFAEISGKDEPFARLFVLELGVLTALIVAISVSLYVLRKHEPKDAAKRS